MGLSGAFNQSSTGRTPNALMLQLAIFVQVGVWGRSERGIPAAGLGLTFLQFRVAAFNQEIAVPY